jgi:hypothetical protein
MVIWTVPQRETLESPTFSLTGVLLSWPDGAPALVTQSPFRWQNDAWQAAVEVSRLGGAERICATIRLVPQVVAAWRRSRLNPRREAATQLRTALVGGDVGVLTLTEP